MYYPFSEKTTCFVWKTMIVYTNYISMFFFSCFLICFNYFLFFFIFFYVFFTFFLLFCYFFILFLLFYCFFYFYFCLFISCLFYFSIFYFYFFLFFYIFYLFSIFSLFPRKFLKFKGWPWISGNSTFFHDDFSKKKIEILCFFQKILMFFSFSTMIFRKKTMNFIFSLKNHRGKKSNLLKFKVSPWISGISAEIRKK